MRTIWRFRTGCRAFAPTVAGVTRRHRFVFVAVLALAAAECLCWLIAAYLSYEFRNFMTLDGGVIAVRTRNAYLLLAWFAVNLGATLSVALRRRPWTTVVMVGVQLGDLAFGLWWSFAVAISIGEIDSADWVFLQPAAAALVLAGLNVLRRRSEPQPDAT